MAVSYTHLDVYKRQVKWQWQYTILCFALSLVVAIAMTYLVELPAAKVIKKCYQKKREKKELENEKQ